LRALDIIYKKVIEVAKIWCKKEIAKPWAKKSRFKTNLNS